MGFRYRKTVRLGRYVRLNLTGNGVNSVSIGRRGGGVTTNISGKGIRQTVSWRGTGISYSEYTPHVRLPDSSSYNLRPSANISPLIEGSASKTPQIPEQVYDNTVSPLEEEEPSQAGELDFHPRDLISLLPLLLAGVLLVGYCFLR